MQETLYERNGRWLTSEQIVEYNKNNKKPETSIMATDIITGEDIEITQEELDNSEEIETLPMTEVIKNESKLPKEVQSKNKKKK